MIAVFFAYFSLVAIVAGVLTVALKNPVHCGLALLALLLHVSGLFILLNAEFLWAVQVIVYTGAIVVLILFVLMLLGVDVEDDITIQPMPGQGVLAGIVAALIGAAVLSVIIIGGESVVTGARSSL